MGRFARWLQVLRATEASTLRVFCTDQDVDYTICIDLVSILGGEDQSTSLYLVRPEVFVPDAQGDEGLKCSL